MAIQKAGGDRKSINVLKKNNDPTVTDIGLDRKQIHEARQIRNAEKSEPGIVRRALDEQLRAGEEPSRSHVKRAIANDKGNKGNRRLRPKQIDPVKDTIVAFAAEGASSTEIAAAPTSSSQSEPAPWMIPAAWGLELLAKNRTMAVLIDHLAPLADELEEENKALDEENTKLVDDYNKLVGDYNELLDDHHKLLGIPSAEEANDDADC